MYFLYYLVKKIYFLSNLFRFCSIDGKIKIIVVPLFNSEFNFNLISYFKQICFTIDKPKPVPCSLERFLST